MLTEVRDAGYDAIEMGGAAGKLGPADELARRLDDAGLTLAAWSAAVTANPCETNRLEYERDLAYAAELGVTAIAVCGGFLGRKFRATFDDDYRLFAENLATAQRYADRFNQTLAFHPHCGCIVETEAEIDRLLACLPGLPLLIDTGHLAAVGEDPARLIRRFAGQVAHVHLKDWDTDAGRFTELGDGRPGVDFPEVLRALAEVGYANPLVVERDAPTLPPDESARRSLAFLQDVLEPRTAEVAEAERQD